MAIEGEVVVRIVTGPGNARRVQARVERPRLARILFGGRMAAEAAPLAGAIFAICGRSQAVAAQSAIDMALGVEAGDGDRAAREIRVAAETVHEHAWRVLVDWPRLEGREPELGALAAAREALAPLLSAQAGKDPGEAIRAARKWGREALFGAEPAEFVGMTSMPALESWLRETRTPAARLGAAMLAGDPGLGGASDVAPLPRCDEGTVRAISAAMEGDDDFEKAPHWRGEPRETGPLARAGSHPLVAAAIAKWGRGVGARWISRLLEMAQALEAMSRGRSQNHGAVALGAGQAVSWVETARGVLVHRVGIEAGSIAQYRIVAPTEWNFHPDGAFARGAQGLPAGGASQLERDVRRLVASLDPCVGVRYEAGHA